MVARCAPTWAERSLPPTSSRISPHLRLRCCLLILRSPFEAVPRFVVSVSLFLSLRSELVSERWVALLPLMLSHLIPHDICVTVLRVFYFCILTGPRQHRSRPVGPSSRVIRTPRWLRTAARVFRVYAASDEKGRLERAVRGRYVEGELEDAVGELVRLFYFATTLIQGHRTVVTSSRYV